MLFRDFAYERRDCFKSLTARAINELFRSHLFVLAVNFHAGISLLGWPWGDSLHCNRGAALGADFECHGGGWEAPDGNAMRGLGQLIAQVAGSVAATLTSPVVPPYKTGVINEVGGAAATSASIRSLSVAGHLQCAGRH
jgi:hypothetical protein